MHWVHIRYLIRAFEIYESKGRLNTTNIGILQSNDEQTAILVQQVSAQTVAAIQQPDLKEVNGSRTDDNVHVWEY